MEIKSKNEFVEKILKEPGTRLEVVKRSHLFFFITYFNHYMKYPMAPMHDEMFDITEDENNPLAVISAFRESGKSTILTLSYALWSLFGVQNKRFIVIVSQTESLAKTHFQTLKRELENNKLLRQDLGPFEEDTQWNSGSLIIPRYNTRIVAMSVEQSIRGLKHGERRPDLILCDDLEDINSTRYPESREKTYRWFSREIVPLGSKDTKILVIGNPLHEDSLIKKLEAGIESGERTGIYREYPIIDDDDNILWPGKYPDMEAIETERKRIGDKFTWANEYLLKILGDKESLVEPEWIHYYQELPNDLRNQTIRFASGVDLAVSEKRHADFTAIVSAKLVGSGDDMKIYILPKPINAKMKLPLTIDNICLLSKSFGEVKPTFYIEEAGTQMGVTQLLKDRSIKAVGVPIGRNDKPTRISLISDWIRSGKIVFPHKGAEDLLSQMIDFWTARNDDLVDALTTLIIGIMEKPPSSITGRVIISTSNFYDRGQIGDGGWGPGRGHSIEFGPDGMPYQRY